MEKLEEYQAYVNEMLDNERSSDVIPRMPITIQPASRQKEKRIVRRGKWKARISNALTVISAILAITILSSIGTALFYGVGDPSRNDKYQDAIASAISISQPNIEVPLSSQGKVFFMQEVYGDIDKKVGKERVTVGEYTVNFLFGRRPSTWTGTNAVVHHGFSTDPTAQRRRLQSTKTKLPRNSQRTEHQSLLRQER